MPELPEVHTTVEGLRKTVIGKKITDVWSDFHVKTAHSHKQNLKNKNYFLKFKKNVVGSKIKTVSRAGKNILVNLDNDHTIVVHMKMTGHLMYGATDPFVHLIFKLKNSKDLVLSDMRKFANVSIIETQKLNEYGGLEKLGPDALTISKKEFIERVKKYKTWPIKSALTKQEAVAGLGNIYSDEVLWMSGVHPLSTVSEITEKKFGLIFKNMKKILKKSIRLGGDSMSDYRNVEGGKGGFQNCHKAYRQTGKKCPKKNCGGIIKRMVIKGRSSHFCPEHQIKF